MELTKRQLGGLRAAEKNKAKNPDHYKKIGALGGQARVPKGFALMDKRTLSEVGRKGGSAQKGAYHAKA